VRNEQDYLVAAALEIGRFMDAPARVGAVDSPDQPGPDWGGMEAAIPLHLPSRTPLQLVLGRRRGGRRYLSEDLRALHRAAAVVVERVEQFRESETRRLVAQAELRALQSQIHPHFLFNALNTLYGIIPREARGARDTVLNLADIFRYFLETRKTHVPLEEELRIVRAYLEIERLRLGEKLVTEFDIAPEASAVAIPILTVQPLVENAVKHGIAPQAAGGVVRVEARREPGGALTVAVHDTGPGFDRRAQDGVGLENVRRRLELSYGGEARLQVESSAAGSRVSLVIPAAAPQPVEALR
jgi:two-component system sensor histidine kinase LytS